jgi:hypothetical protein
MLASDFDLFVKRLRNYDPLIIVVLLDNFVDFEFGKKIVLIDFDV